MTATEVQKQLEEWSCREFDVNTTINQMQVKRHKFICWGAKGFKNWNNKALLFTVSGLLFKGIVVITLSWMDTYDIHYLNRSFNEVLDSDTDIYCDMLTDVIDGKIEMKVR